MIIVPGSIRPRTQIQPGTPRSSMYQCERIGRLQIGFFISPNHQPVYDQDISTGYCIARLHS
jgi:hypothetical protein